MVEGSGLGVGWGGLMAFLDRYQLLRTLYQDLEIQLRYRLCLRRVSSQGGREVMPSTLSFQKILGAVKKLTSQNYGFSSSHVGM